MKNVLLTGGSGFIGRNIRPYLEKICHVYAPDRFDLDLYNEVAVREYIERNDIDIVIHSANPNPVKNSLDHQDTMFEDSIRMFLNLYAARDLYEMMYSLGSGAEYDKSKPISMVTEREEFRSVPYDSYGLAKYTINKIISEGEKACNLRIFACYGPTDFETKFITHCINCVQTNKEITIRQDCFFDFMQVSDFAKILEYFIYNKPSYKSYNVCTGKRITLKQIAELVRMQMKVDNEIIILKSGMNNEYTASNERLITELGAFDFISIDEGIRIQIESEMEK